MRSAGKNAAYRPIFHRNARHLAPLPVRLDLVSTVWTKTTRPGVGMADGKHLQVGRHLSRAIQWGASAAGAEAPRSPQGSSRYFMPVAAGSKVSDSAGRAAAASIVARGVVLKANMPK